MNQGWSISVSSQWSPRMSFLTVSQASGMRNSGAVKMIQDKTQPDTASRQGHIWIEYLLQSTRHPKRKQKDHSIHWGVGHVFRNMIQASAAMPMRSEGVPAKASLVFSCNHTEELTLHLRNLLWDHSLKKGRNANLHEEQLFLSSQTTRKLSCPLVLWTTMHTSRCFRWENPSLL